MEIDFKDRTLKDLCEQAKLSERKLGTKMARKLRARLADLMAASSVTELPRAGRPHPLKGDRAGKFALDLVHQHRLVFKPAHNPVPRLQDSGIDWSRVTRVYIIWIEDYRG